MELEKAIQILHIVKCDLLGYARDLSYTPTKEDIRQAFDTMETYVESKHLN